MPDDLIHGLLSRQRLLVIVDALSERDPETQRYFRQDVFSKTSIFNAVVVTSRTDPLRGTAVDRTLLSPLLLDQEYIVRFSMLYVAQLTDADPLQGNDAYLKLGNRIFELAGAGVHSTPLTPLLVTLFVESALRRARAGESLDSLPQDVPEVFIDYLRGVHAGPAVEAGSLGELQFIRAASVLAKVSLGDRMIPYDFLHDEALRALEALIEESRGQQLLDALISGGVIERRYLGDQWILRFALDPVAEYLGTIQTVTELRQLNRSEVEARIFALTKIEGYPETCDGYLRAFATCYRAYRGEHAFRLPDVRFPWEASTESPQDVSQPIAVESRQGPHETPSPA